jgi:SAM-dependent methyltransferase
MAFDDLQFPTAQTGNRFIRVLKIAIGRLISWVAPAIAARIAAGQMPPRIGFVERAVIACQVHRHMQAGTLDQLAPLHAWLWRGEQAVSFHEQAKARFDGFWLAHHSAIVKPVRQLFEPDSSGVVSAYRRLCEIGCGSGLVLEDIAQRLPNVQLLVGLDLSERQTQINRSRDVDPRIRFETGDAMAWIPAYGEAGTVYLTVAGVFEYFPRQALQEMFAYMAEHQSPVAVALIEPIPADYDFENEDASRPYGFENSLGHNYLRLLRNLGFTTRFQEIQVVEGQTFLLLVAEKM